MHKPYSIPPPSRKLLPPTQINSTSLHQPCKTLRLHKMTTKVLLADYPPLLFLAAAAPAPSFTGHKPKCLRICRSRVLPANSHQLLTRVGATEDETWHSFSLSLAPPRTVRPSSPSRWRGTGRRGGPRFLGKFQASAGAPRCACMCMHWALH